MARAPGEDIVTAAVAEALRQSTYEGARPIGAAASTTAPVELDSDTALPPPPALPRSRSLKRAHGLLVAAIAGLIGLWAGGCPAADPGHYKVAGVEVFYGVIPSQVILAHPAAHAERKMHGGVPGGPHQYHLIVSLFDAATEQRIVDAEVTARVSAVGSPTQQKELEHMELAGAPTYGNYFSMPPGTYRIQVYIRRPGAPRPVSATFQYSHGVPGS